MDWTRDEYVGRPSVSPVVAALAAAGVLPAKGRILDAGCGRGTDAIALAAMGFRRIDALDVNATALRAAKRRAARLGLAERIAWRKGSALDLAAHYPRATFDAAIDTLLVNNLRDDDVRAYLDGLARVLKRGGLLVLQSKVWPRELTEAEDGLPEDALRRFRPVARFGTHLAERASRGGRAIPVVVRMMRKG